MTAFISCYKTWNEAQEFCVENCGELWEPKDMDEFEYVKDELYSYYYSFGVKDGDLSCKMKISFVLKQTNFFSLIWFRWLCLQVRNSTTSKLFLVHWLIEQLWLLYKGMCNVPQWQHLLVQSQL